MPVQKPKGLHVLLSQEFSNSELEAICMDLSVDVEDLPSQKSSRARELLRYAQRRNRLDKLLNWLGENRPEDNFYDYLYLLIQDAFNTVADMKALSVALGVDYQNMLVRGLGYNFESQNTEVIEAQAWELYRLMAESGRQGELLWVMQQQKPRMNLAVFAVKTPPVAPGGVSPAGGDKPTDGSGENGRPPVQILAYEDFVLRINDKTGDNSYPVEVLHSPQGEVKKVGQQFPLNDPEFQDLLTYLKDLWATSNDAMKLGHKMRQLLFPGEVWTKFRESVTAVRQTNKGLRIRLRIDPPELEKLPWEYCYDETLGYLAHNAQTPLMRYPAESLPPGDLTVPLPLRILLATANPTGMTQLQVEREVGIVQQVLEPFVATDLARVDVIPQATIGKLRKALTDGGYHIFHFIGHGVVEGGNGALVLENDDRTPRKVFFSQLKVLLQNTAVKVVILNACETAAFTGDNPTASVARALLQAEVPAVMAMQFQVPDKTSLLLAQTLYESLALGRPLDQAVTEMRRAIFLEGEDMVFWGIPVLYLRAPNGVIWPAAPDTLGVMAKLAAYKSQPPLVRAMKGIAASLATVKADLESDAWVELQETFQAAEPLAEDATQAKKLLLKLKAMINLLEVYGISGDNPLMQALVAAQKQVLA